MSEDKKTLILSPRATALLPGTTASNLPAPYIPQGVDPVLPEYLKDAAKVAQAASKSAGTRKVYDAAWRSFQAWCFQRRGTSLPATPTAVAGYLLELSQPTKTKPRGLSVSTMEIRLAAIKERHLSAGLPDPTAHQGVLEVFAGLRRQVGVAKKGKSAADLQVIRKLLWTLDTKTLQGKRDAAVLLVGFAGAFRRSTLVARTVADLTWVDGGVVIHVDREKQDQEGEGRDVGIAAAEGLICPVKALKAWLDAAKITEGAIFRGVTRHGTVLPEGMCDRNVAEIVKKACEKAGLDEKLFSGHSMRSGHVTEGFAQGVPADRLMSQTGHTSIEMLMKYKRRADAIAGGSSKGLLDGKKP